MFQLIDGDELAVADHIYQLFQRDILAMAHIGLRLNIFDLFEFQRFRITVLQDEASGVG